MGSSQRIAPGETGPTVSRLGWAALVLLPLAMAGLLLAIPEIDEKWENHPIHFWLVLVPTLIGLGLALTISENGRRRSDARLLLIGLAFATTAGFQGLHALATPGVIIEGKNAGFALATPVGLLIAGVFAAASAVEFDQRSSLKVVRLGRLLQILILALLFGWAFVSLTDRPPLHTPIAPDQLRLPLAIVALVGCALYAYAAISYFRIYRRRGGALALAISIGFALLAETLIVIFLSLGTSWRISWWEWHSLQFAGFVCMGLAASREWYEERFSAVYLDETLRGSKEVSVLFADLVGFTPFSEEREPGEVYDMLTAYFGALTPVLGKGFGGEVAQFVGDQIFVIFNKAGDQPDHATRASGAALELQRIAEEIRVKHPEWPQFRVGVNSGEAVTGVVGEHGHRAHVVIGDTVNLGARLQGQAPPGGVVIGEKTRELLPDSAVVQAMEPLNLKGKSAPVTAFLLLGI